MSSSPHIITNLVDLARANTPHHQCATCRVAVHHMAGFWRDGGGAEYCPDRVTKHLPVQVWPPAPVVARSPLLGGYR